MWRREMAAGWQSDKVPVGSAEKVSTCRARGKGRGRGVAEEDEAKNSKRSDTSGRGDGTVWGRDRVFAERHMNESLDNPVPYVSIPEIH